MRAADSLARPEIPVRLWAACVWGAPRRTAAFLGFRAALGPIDGVRVAVRDAARHREGGRRV